MNIGLIDLWSVTTPTGPSVRAYVCVCVCVRLSLGLSHSPALVQMARDGLLCIGVIPTTHV